MRIELLLTPPNLPCPSLHSLAHSVSLCHACMYKAWRRRVRERRWGVGKGGRGVLRTQTHVHTMLLSLDPSAPLRRSFVFPVVDATCCKYNTTIKRTQKMRNAAYSCTKHGVIISAIFLHPAPPPPLFHGAQWTAEAAGTGSIARMKAARLRREEVRVCVPRACRRGVTQPPLDQRLKGGTGQALSHVGFCHVHVRARALGRGCRALFSLSCVSGRSSPPFPPPSRPPP